ncbi:hypothetical protein [Colwellia sp. MEBiC06753]
MKTLLICLTLSYFIFSHASANAAEINLTSYNQAIAIQPEQTFYELQAQLNSEMSPKEQAKLLVLLSEVAYFVDQSEKILTYVEQAMASGMLDKAWYSSALVNKARAHYQRREYELFLLTAQAAYESAKQSSTPTIEAAALIELTFANVILEKDNQLELNLKLIQKYLSYLKDDLDKGVLLQRYSAVLRNLNRFDQARIPIQQTIPIFEKIGSKHFISISYYNLGRIEQEQGHYQQAADAMELSYQWASKDKNFLNQAFSLSRLAEYQEHLGQIESAKKSLELAKDSATKVTSTRVQLLVYKKVAEFSCRNEASTLCYQQLNDAITLAKNSGLVKDDIELTRFLATMYAKDKRYQQAYETLAASIESSSN